MAIEYYNRNAKEFYRNTVNADMSEHYSAFLEYIPHGGKILDAGCGSGRDSKFFLTANYKVVAFDASQEMVTLSSNLIGQPVKLLKFNQLEFTNEFDGIWACASLLHVSKKEIDDALGRLTKALKPNGVIYASFKYGNREVVRNGRFFNLYDESSFDELLKRHPLLTKIKYMITEDVRQERTDQIWFSALMIGRFFQED